MRPPKIETELNPEAPCESARASDVPSGSARAQVERLSVLVLDEEIPFPPNAGKRIRTWNLLRRLARRHDVSLLCYGDRRDPGRIALESAGIRVHLVDPLPVREGWRLYGCLLANLMSPYPYSVAKHYSRRLHQGLLRLLQGNRYDLIHCEWTPYARFLEHGNALPVLVAAHNVESQIWDRRAQYGRTFLEGVFFGIQAAKMRQFETRVLRHADGVTAVTPQDAEWMCASGVRRVTLVPNGVDLDFFRPTLEPTHSSELLFLASLDWHPNLDALEYFLTEIMPLVRARHPEATLRIVGRRPPSPLQQRVAGLPWAKLIGEVEDVRSELARAAVVVVPLRIGGGSRIKILESLAAGKAVVSTTIGAEGLSLTAETHLVIADAPADFAYRTVGLLTSSEERRRFEENGRRCVVERYGWDAIAERLETAWLGTCRPGSSATRLVEDPATGELAQ